MAHLAVGLGFALLAVGLTWPLAANLATHVPGPAADDNVAATWNFWWMRHALGEEAAHVFRTTHLFHPAGSDLILHSFSPLTAAAGATIFGGFSIPAAFNLCVIAAAWANGVLAYLLAHRVTRHTGAAILAGVVFAASPALAGHLYAGHLNYFSAWVLPGFALALLAALDRGGPLRAVAAGAALAVVAFTDAYYLVFALVLLACVVLTRGLEISRRERARPPRRRLDHALVAIAAGAVALSVWIAVTGGGVYAIAGVRVSMTSGLNVRTLAWAAILIWLWRRRRRGVVLAPRRDVVRRDLRVVALVLATWIIAVLPLVIEAVRVWQSGAYVTQRYLWQSSPAGIDLGTLVLGSPFNTFTGPAVRRFLEAHGLPWATLWPGIVPLAVLIVTRRVWTRAASVRVWAIVAIVFALWSLGPHLVVFGVRSGLLLPQFLLRFVPIVSNARMPGHAAALVYLALAMIVALGIAGWRHRRGPWLVTVAIPLVVLDSWPMPFPLTRLDWPPVYRVLAQQEAGAVLEVPFGIRDGFGADGHFEPRSLFYQSIHEHPLIGGYLARIAPHLKDRYRRSPALGALLTLSAGGPATAPIPSPSDVRAELSRLGVRYVVVNTATATAAVSEFIDALSLPLLARDELRRLYALRD